MIFTDYVIISDNSTSTVDNYSNRKEREETPSAKTAILFISAFLRVLGGKFIL